MKRFLCLMLCLLLCLPALAVGEALSPGREAVELLVSGDVDTLYARFSPEMQQAVPKETLASTREQFTELCGAYVGIISEKSMDESTPTVYSFRLGFENMDVQALLFIDADSIICSLDLTLVAKLTQETAEALPDGLEESEVVVDAGEGYPLNGTLTMPKTGESLPAVVLVHGSGPSDRDEAIGQTKLFQDIAWGLAQRGIAVLRYEKRTETYGEQIASSPDYASFTVEEETISDAIAAGRLLKGNPRVDAKQIILCGHSMGALLGPRIVSESDGVFAKMILLSGTPYPLVKVAYDQSMDAIASLTGEQYAAYKALIDAGWEKYETLSAMTEEEQKQTTALGMPGYYVATMAENPIQYINALNLPTLIVNGGEDFQVRPSNGYDAWVDALKDSAAPIQLENLPALNHVLMRYTGPEVFKGTTKEYDTPAHLDAEALQIIADFILQ